VITSALIALTLASLLARNACGLLFVAASFLHSTFLAHLDGFLYYGSAAFFAYLTLLLSSRSIVVQVICLISIVLNMFGYMVWYLYMPPTIYNYTCCILYIVAAFVITMDRGSGTRAGLYRGGFNLYTDSKPWRIFHHTMQAKK